MGRPRRIDGCSYVGLNRYFLTFCVIDRRQAFVDGDVVHVALAQFRKTAAVEKFSLSAYCFMPDHVHLLVEATDQRSDLRRFAKLAKQRAGAAYALMCRGRLWQEGYYERVLRDDDASRDIARYIIANPVRGGLVTSPIEYPYIGSDVWTLQELLEDVMLY
jgi:putative transposase